MKVAGGKDSTRKHTLKKQTKFSEPIFFKSSFAQQSIEKIELKLGEVNPHCPGSERRDRSLNSDFWNGLVPHALKPQCVCPFY
jgi:hypothetical protein